jgi:hypothetical protein
MNAGSWVARRRPIYGEPSTHGRHASGPRFERFAAAMQAAPPPEAQVLPETPDTTPADVRPVPHPAAARPRAEAAATPRAHSYATEPTQPPPPFAAPAGAPIGGVDFEAAPRSDSGAAGPTVIPRRPVIEEGGRARADVPWLGIGSWLLLCGALFASLVWPDQMGVNRLAEKIPYLDRVVAMWSGDEPTPTAQGEAMPAQDAPADEQGWSAVTPGPADEPEALPPTELAPPIRSEAPADGTTGDGPPLPRFKPKFDEIAATFSNAFYEIGDRLQREGEFEAAVHMRRQGSNLDPFKTDL